MNLTSAQSQTSMLVSVADMLSHRSALVRFAQRKLHDPALAEDVVHDVFEAVLSGKALFSGRSLLRSWLTAILKNKIVDMIRQRAHYASLEINDESGECQSNELTCPQPRPDEWAEQRQDLEHTMQSIQRLPKALCEVVTLRILQDQPTEAVCAALDITEENLFVRLHRARKQLAVTLQ